MLIDTHAHIHDRQYRFNPDQVIETAARAGVETIICVGTSADDSAKAVEFVQDRPSCFATIGLHPHEAKLGAKELDRLRQLVDQPKVVAVGECGLDYYYKHSSKRDQEKALRFQIGLALEHHKPLVFHVRDAFDDFWRIIGDYPNIKGVIHSFTSAINNLDRAIEHNFLVAFNGIMTFTKDQTQLAVAKAAPRERIVLETDSPFLTPAPYRGKVNEPANAQVVANFLAQLRQETLVEFAQNTTLNAKQLFKL